MEAGKGLPLRQDAAKSAANCRHDWIITQLDGPTSRGYCRHCKEAGIFVNGNDWLHADSSEAVEAVLPGLLRLIL